MISLDSLEHFVLHGIGQRCRRRKEGLCRPYIVPVMASTSEEESVAQTAPESLSIFGCPGSQEVDLSRSISAIFAKAIMHKRGTTFPDMDATIDKFSE